MTEDPAVAVILLIASIVVAMIALFAFLRGPNQPPRRQAIIAQYEPPALSVLGSATLIGTRRRSVSAQIVDLAVRGALDIVPPPTPNSPYALVARGVRGHAEVASSAGDGAQVDAAARGIHGTPVLDEVELAVYRAIFGAHARAGDRVRVHPRNAKLNARLSIAQATATTQLASREFVDGPRQRWRPVLPVLQVALLALGSGVAPGLIVPIGILLLATIALTLGRYRALTAAGVALRGHVAGLRLYISLAEADRLRMLQGPTTALTRGEVLRLTERLLGWAVLFGFEREWARVLALYAKDESDAASVDSLVVIGFSDTFAGVSLTDGTGSLDDDTSAPGDSGVSGGSDGDSGSGGSGGSGAGGSGSVGAPDYGNSTEGGGSSGGHSGGSSGGSSGGADYGDAGGGAGGGGDGGGGGGGGD
ncbi:DUF2207 family protein [Marisediminicola senii]|uniref:DUF2207 family protein n=1 Tax=Marisediminicola senii TaxID=2711233 RepID=UPI0013EE0E5A|nr:DUF2207 domain-containing protein [Marisediminicola senii]